MISCISLHTHTHTLVRKNLLCTRTPFSAFSSPSLWWLVLFCVLCVFFSLYFFAIQSVSLFSCHFLIPFVPLFLKLNAVNHRRPYETAEPNPKHEVIRLTNWKCVILGVGNWVCLCVQDEHYICVGDENDKINIIEKTDEERNTHRKWNIIRIELKISFNPKTYECNQLRMWIGLCAWERQLSQSVSQSVSKSAHCSCLLVRMSEEIDGWWSPVHYGLLLVLENQPKCVSIVRPKHGNGEHISMGPRTVTRFNSVYYYVYVGCSLNSKWNLLFHRSPYCKRLTSASATILLNFILSVLFTSIIDGISILCININLMRARLLPPRQTAAFLMKSSEFMNIHAHPTHISTPILFVQILLISVLQTHILRLVLDIDSHFLGSFNHIKCAHTHTSNQATGHIR